MRVYVMQPTEEPTWCDLHDLTHTANYICVPEVSDEQAREEAR